MSFDFDELARKWPSPIVARHEVGRFSGGVLNSRTLANADSLGEGPERGKIGRKVFYPVGSLISWMKDKAEASA